MALIGNGFYARVLFAEFMYIDGGQLGNRQSKLSGNFKKMARCKMYLRVKESSEFKSIRELIFGLLRLRVLQASGNDSCELSRNCS